MAIKWVRRLNMFNSARLSLTLFYLGIIVLLNLLVTVSARVLAEREFRWAVQEQQTAVNRLNDTDFANGNDYQNRVEKIQDRQFTIVSQHLNQNLLVINLCAFVVGGILSYWFAGRALSPIKEALELQARFTADASHEMKTPLANMRLENEIFLRQKSFTPQEAKEQIESNLEEVQRLEKLSLTMLALHQYGQVTLDRAPTFIAPVIEEVLHQHESTFATRKIKVHHKIVPAKIMVNSDSIKQLMSILIDNAVKHGSQGKSVSVNGSLRGKWYVIAVIDKGPGIAQEDLPYIFNRLYRGDKARSKRTFGYGLGLALAQEISTSNGGYITAENSKRGGAKFEVMLPLVAKTT